MGSGRWDTDVYIDAHKTRVSSGIPAFHHSQTSSTIHKDLDPKRIKDKVGGMLESRDSVDHPESNSVFVTFDVTGSNIHCAEKAQIALAKMMDLLPNYLSDPQLAFGANDDIHAVGADLCTQVSEFESDNRIDESLRLIKLTGNGGGNSQESYDFLLFIAARLMAMDCVEVRGKKGYMFMYADEPFPTMLMKDEVRKVFGVEISEDMRIETLIEEVQEKFHLFALWPATSSYVNSRKQYEKLLGEEHVFILESPEQISEAICGIIAVTESKATPDQVRTDLVRAGFSAKSADSISQALVPRSQALSQSASGLPALGNKTDDHRI